ncbi:MAG TPA: nucleotidyltransferase family protein [Candidatus Thermoplasmatota archaeon]|nr:nucleotidyltransferase family protein [Candidatus Thermoplasmatota archaeon]
MARPLPIQVPREGLAEFCLRHHIRKLSFFGSVLRDDFSHSSDVDVLVEFEDGRSPGLLGLAGMERELSSLLGRRADLNTEGFLSPYFAAEVLKEAQPQYVAA